MRNDTCAAVPNNVTSQQQQQKPNQQLCASCDRCRARKTKCDGNRPCGNCVTRYKKLNKCDSLEGVDFSAFDCVYSPAKRRGPIPGRSAQSRNNANAASNKNHHAPINNSNNAVISAASAAPQAYYGAPPNPGVAAGLANTIGSNLNDSVFALGLNIEGTSPAAAAGGGGGGQQNAMMNNPIMNITGSSNNGSNGNTFSGEELKQMLALQQQLLVQQQHVQQQQQQQSLLQQLAAATGSGNNNNGNSLPTVNSTLTAGNNTATVGIANIMGGVPNNFWTENLASGIGNMGGSNNGALGGLNLNTTDGFINNTPSFHVQQQHTPVAVLAANNHKHLVSVQSDIMNPAAKRIQRSEAHSSSQVPNSVAAHLPLLQLNNPNGAILRSYYELSTNDVLNLPPIPTDQEYCALLNIDCNAMPTYDRSALQAARFSELALGALANNQISLAMELSNSSVMCLRNCVSTEETSHTSSLYNVARAYLLHGIFRSFRGDMVRYFKYRRVCMTHILQMNNAPDVEALVAAISFHDAWAYIMHNADEDSLPDIDEILPRLNSIRNGHGSTASSNNGGCNDPYLLAADPINQMWMQGSPQVFLNNEASLYSRSLDGLACAVRTCSDQAKDTFQEIAQSAGMDLPRKDEQQLQGLTPTTAAVMANENELCSRNIVLSAKSLLDQHSGMSNGTVKKHGLYMVTLVMSAFLENGEQGDTTGGFTDEQIKNLLAGCDILIQHPLLLHCPGPIYHMTSNAAILLCHLLNGMYAKSGAAAASNGGSHSSVSNDKVEGILFDEVLDTFMATRKALNNHRKTLPVRLRCHGIPRPSSIGPFKRNNYDPELPFIDLGDTLMCLCRCCQNFVFMGCSPCVAAERSIKASMDQAKQDQKSLTEEKLDCQEFDRELGEMDDLSLDDDALLDVLSRIVQN